MFELHHLWQQLQRPWGFILVSAILQIIFALASNQKVLAIYDAAVFILGWLLLFFCAFRYQLLALIYMLLALGAFVMGAFFLVSTIDDFYHCSHVGCQGSKELFFQLNWVFLAFTVAVHGYSIKMCWLILSVYRQLARERRIM
jgi:hypothetical protein